MYVDGEQVAQYAGRDASERAYLAIKPIWIGVNPDRNFETDIDFLFAGLKEVQI